MDAVKVGPHQIAIVDPANEEVPQVILKGNFSPAPPPFGAGHVRWEYRNQPRNRTPVDWAAVLRTDGSPLVGPEIAAALEGAGFYMIEDIAERGDGLMAVPGMSVDLAAELSAWAVAHSNNAGQPQDDLEREAQALADAAHADALAVALDPPALVVEAAEQEAVEVIEPVSVDSIPEAEPQSEEPARQGRRK